MSHQTGRSQGVIDTATLPVSLIISEVELLLAEKRTALSVMRTGIAVIALPLSLLSILIATSRLYVLSSVMHWVIPLGAVNLGLMAFGIYLMVRSVLKIRELDERILALKKRMRAASGIAE